MESNLLLLTLPIQMINCQQVISNQSDSDADIEWLQTKDAASEPK